MSIPTTVKEYLKAMKQVLLTDGWCQRHFYSPTGQHCLLGAGFAVRTLDPTYSGKLDDLLSQAQLRIITALPQQYHRNVVRWNDRPTRTKDEVLEFLDKVIKETEV